MIEPTATARDRRTRSVCEVADKLRRHPPIGGIFRNMFREASSRIILEGFQTRGLSLPSPGSWGGRGEVVYIYCHSYVDYRPDGKQLATNVAFIKTLP
ncbi:hypothetical protein SAMD00023353_1502150 [Rosellinia necatrix]|uniref:Uncharacterized protein n=1 Tax=Rosellinia necatrix TaxID=77044 RepID=A0A1W2TRE4_ROSNE|nr:hypothetical protein SAMD00023353_1502150 [Rosellinia necatrix]